MAGKVAGDEMAGALGFHRRGDAMADILHRAATPGECAADRKLKLKSFDVVRRGEDVYVVAE